jgi:hypothetical protein
MIKYLGVIILHNHVEMDPVKVVSVAAWPTPENKDVQQFLGLANFYRRFIQAFSDVAWPLVDLTKKDVVWCSKVLSQEPFLGNPTETGIYRNLQGVLSSSALVMEGRAGLKQKQVKRVQCRSIGDRHTP